MMSIIINSEKAGQVGGTRGFTLVEIIAALTLTGLLVSGGVLLLKARTERRLRAETLEYLQEAKRAVLAFAKVNKRLPSPDTNYPPDGVSNAFSEEGVLPFVTLGLKPVDAWGRKIWYSVSRDMYSTDFNRVCTTLRQAYFPGSFTYPGASKVSDQISEGSWASFVVPAVLVSGGSGDANGLPVNREDQKVFDGANLAGLPAGASNNYWTNGKNFVRAPTSQNFDDLVVYIDPWTLDYTLGCAGSSLPVSGPNTP